MFFWHDDHMENMTIAFHLLIFYPKTFLSMARPEHLPREIVCRKITVSPNLSLFTEKLVFLLCCGEGFKDSERKKCIGWNEIT